MSNLATAEHLRRAASQLPVSWYFDPAGVATPNSGCCSRTRPGTSATS